MGSILRACGILVSLVVIGGCIVGDELTTLTICPDGSADLVVFRSNLHSTQKGSEAEKELADYKSQFTAQAGDEFDRIRDAGGKLTATSWVREHAPLSNVVRAHFPNASVLQKFCTVKDEDGGLAVTTRFHSDGSHRRLAIQVTVSPDKIDSFQAPPPDIGQLMQRCADGISATRIAVAKGAITKARGFTVAGDKQSALLNVSALAELVRAGKGKAELLLEWDVLVQ